MYIRRMKDKKSQILAWAIVIPTIALIVYLFSTYLTAPGLFRIPTAPSSSASTYKSDKYFYQINFPATWQESHQHPVPGLNDHIPGIPSNGTILDHDVFYKKPASTIFSVSITPITNPQNLSLDNWVQQYVPAAIADEHLKPVFPKVTDLGNTTIGGLLARRIQLEYKGMSTEIVYIVGYKHLIYMIEYPKDSEFESEKIVSTLTFQ